MAFKDPFAEKYVVVQVVLRNCEKVPLLTVTHDEAVGILSHFMKRDLTAKSDAIMFPHSVGVACINIDDVASINVVVGNEAEAKETYKQSI